MHSKQVFVKENGKRKDKELTEKISKILRHRDDVMKDADIGKS